MKSRRFTDRLLDRAWTEFGKRLEDCTPPPVSENKVRNHSVSSTMEWPLACSALASGLWTSKGFRRARAVREVVETLGPSDGLHFAKWIQQHSPEWIEDKRMLQLNEWGNPIQAPGWTLGLPRSFSPTSMRYLAHALWLRQEGLVQPGGTIVEIGVGFGGLAAANALVSKAKTLFIDLPEVQQAACSMLRENGLEDYIINNNVEGDDYCLISNYAFTELSTSLQERYFEEAIRRAKRGAIVSNAGMFAQKIGGRSDDDLLSWFRNEGIPAETDSLAPILSPADHQCKVRVIRWARVSPPYSIAST